MTAGARSPSTECARWSIFATRWSSIGILRGTSTSTSSTSRSSASRTRSAGPRLEELGTAQGDATGFTRVIYLEVLEEHRAKLAEAVAAVGHAAAGGVVVHCHAGKDRTGLVTALLLRLAGVPIDEVSLDYAESEQHLAVRNKEWIADGADEAERDWRRLVTSTPAEGMRGVLEEIDRRYGDVASYLRAGGAADADLDAVRARLLDD